MRKAQNKKKILSQLLRVTPVLLFALVGTYLVFTAKGQQVPSWCDDGVCVAYAPNPPLARNCGIDVLLLVDGSGSMATLPENGDGTDSFYVATRAMKNLISTLKNNQMYFAVGKIDQPDYRHNNHEVTFTQNTAALMSAIDNFESGGGSDIADLSWVTEIDPRPDRQNLIIVLTDFEIGLPGAQSISRLKQSGTRFLSLEVREVGEASEPKHRLVTDFTSGPQVNTGNLLTSDVVVMTPQDIGTNFSALSQQLCSPPGGSGPGPGNGNGNGGTGNGTGIGGTGSGTNGSGQGVDPGNGTGGGSSGATATRQGNDPNSLPSATGQGNAEEQPKLEPSPFFDGRTYAPGSDPIDKALGNLSIGGKRILHGWLYLLILFVVIGNVIAGYFLWWRRMPTEQQAVWKAKLHLGQ